MKKNLLTFVAMAYVAVVSQMISCTSPLHIYEPVRTNEPPLHAPHDSTRYRKDQVIVFFKGEPKPGSVKDLKANMHGQYFDTTKLNIRKCRSCKGYIELWEAPNIHTRIHADGIAAGSKGSAGTRPVGEDALAYYSLNFMQEIPVDPTEINLENFKFDSLKKAVNTSGKQPIRVAVLDTGIDTKRAIDPSYLWTNDGEVSDEAKVDIDDDKNCYTDDSSGWNFIADNFNLHDDDPKLHGTLVSQYIINEFASSAINAVELMPLKTHDKYGNGDLFSAICAIHYAMENGAQIINASWGFYYYDDDPHPYLNRLITEELRKEGILFVTAAGNRTARSDNFAKKAYMDEHGIDIPDSYLRNLEYHNFYPAYLSRNYNNVITATTANNAHVSPTQNYSNKYVDFGVFPDHVNATSMRFNFPFSGPDGRPISGSSFAAAIVTGWIGATLPHTTYASSLDKRDLFIPLDAAPQSTMSSVLKPEHIRSGRLTKHN